MLARFWRRLLTRPAAATGGEEVMVLARRLAPLLDGLAAAIVREHGQALLAEEITYVVPAVWGAKAEGSLTPTQLAIHQEVSQTYRQAFAILDLTGLSPAQEYALGYLLRDLIIAKVVYRLGVARAGLAGRPAIPATAASLRDLEVIGHA